MDILGNLNKEQIEAVTSTEGYVRVIAGAGSGKTRTLTHRYAYLVTELGVSTANILCATFTNKAAKEMKSRIRNMIGDMDLGYVCTFHGLGVQILREDIHVINYPKNFVVMDNEDTEQILKMIYENNRISSSVYKFKDIREHISFEKCRKFSHIPYFMEMDNQTLKSMYENAEDMKEKIYLGYLYEQRKNYGLDYDDLITVALYILKNNEEKRLKWQNRMMYVMVDEFQDVGFLDQELAHILSDYHKNYFIVGDPNQTIYTWRGADIKRIMNFDKQYIGTKTIKLNKNYRSTPEIVNAANSLIEKNAFLIPNEIVAMKDSHVLTVYNHSKTTKEEAKWIVKQIKLLVGNGAKYSEIAILYRAHFVSRSIEEIFLKENIPHILFSGVEFYKRKEIKDIVAYMRMVAYADDLSFARVINEPKRNIGTKRIAFLSQYAESNNCSLYNALKANIDNALFTNTEAKKFLNVIEKYSKTYREMKLSDIFTGVLNDSGYDAMLRTVGEDERLENLAELKESIFEFEKNSGEESTLEDYLQNIALYTNSDMENKKDSVKMMTIHIAKGLEFPYVFVCGLNEGIFPSSHARTIDELEEERRLAYVAYTRAENALFLTDAEGVNYEGLFRHPSRFIFNTDKKFLKYETELDEELAAKAQSYIKSQEVKMYNPKTMLKAGDKVEHKVFGIGEIVEINDELSTYVIKFEQLQTNRNLNFNAPLIKL